MQSDQDTPQNHRPASDVFNHQTPESGTASSDDHHQDAAASLAEKLRDLKGTDAFSLLVKTLEEIIPQITHVQLLLFPTDQSKRQPVDSAIHETAARSSTSSCSSTRIRSAAQLSSSSALPGMLGCQDITYTWDNTCLFSINKNSRLSVQHHHPWPLMCSASFCSAMVTRSVLRTNNYTLLGPHFMDWQHLSTEGALCVAAVPMTHNSMPVASLTVASSSPNALPCDSTLQLFASLLVPHARRLTYTSRRMEVERLVQSVVTPLAAELSVQQGRFKRVKNACGEDVLCLDESRGLRGPRAPGSQGSEETDASEQAGVGHMSSAPHGAVRMMGVRIQEPLLGEVHLPPKRIEKPPPATKRGRAPDVVDHIDLNWSDFLFNLISMCIVYAYFSKAAGPHESITAVLLCMAVAAFDILLLLLRWLWADHYLNYGLILCVFQVYRVFLLPFANTWMLWSLVKKLELEVSFFMWVTQGLLLIGCYLCSLKLRALLHVPVQLVTVCFCASTAVRCCSRSGFGFAVLGCMCGIMWMQILFSIVAPALLMHMLESTSCRSFVPHVQAKRAAFHA